MSTPFDKLEKCYEYCKTVTDFQPRRSDLGIRTRGICEKYESCKRDLIRPNSGVSGFRQCRDMMENFYLVISGKFLRW